MTKKITPNFLRHVVVLIIFCQSLNFFSKNSVDLNLHPSNYSSENIVEFSKFYGDLDRTIAVHYDTGNEKNLINVDKKHNFNVYLPNKIRLNYSDISNRIYFEVNTALDDASFNYGNTSYCQAASDPTPTVTGEAGGTFSSTSGLSINASTGAIDLSASTLGSYIVTYTTTAPDQNSATRNITIYADVATFSYGTSRVNKNDADLYPTTSGQSGSYSSTSGISINSSSGIIDVSASSVGTYTVSYTTNGGCPKVYTDTVTIIDTVFPGVSQYQNVNKKYIEYIPGTMPIIISAPHGGRLQPGELSNRNCGTNEMDDNTDVLIKEIQKKCFDQFGVYPYIIVNRLHRRKLDPNRNESVATCGNATTRIYFDAFHDFIDMASADITSKFGKGLFIDLHGQSHSVPRIEAGYNLPRNSFDEDLNNSSTNATELSRVTILNLINNNIQNLTFEDLIRGTQSLGGIMQVTGGQRYANLGHAGCGRTEGYRTVPSHISSGSSQGSCDDTNPGNYAYFAGDYYSNIRHGSGDTNRANTVVQGGGTVNGGGGTIDGVMTEVNRRVRDLGSFYSSTYGVSDSRDATIPYFSRDYAKVIEKFIDVHYNDFSKFSYAANTHSIYGVDATPSITGISGGTFSSTSGLVIDASSGVIDVSESTQGTYIVTYTAPNISSYYKKEFQVTINAAAVTNEFTATSGDWSVDSNWSLARIPTTNDLISIPTGKTVTIKSTGISAANVSVAGRLRINPGKSLTVTGNLTTTGTFIIKSNATSSGSLIVMGTSNGNLTYKRNIKNSTAWFMVSSPLKNQDIDAFANSHPLAVGSGNNRGLGTYNNSSTAWEYYQNGTSNSGNFELAKGHALRFTEAKNAEFTGSLETENFSKSVSLGANGWNLLGNPYPTFISVNGAAQSTNNLIDINTNLLQSGFKAIYFWDSNEYKPFNNASSAKFVAPGQGYFVRVNATSSEGNANTYIQINENMQSHQTGDLFSRSHSDRFEINLKIMDGSIEKYTEIKYINGTTTGLDEGYDAGMFDGANNSFSVYTHLVSDSDGTNYSLQALPDSNYENMIVPVGINASASTAITFSLESINIPSGLKIFLEDKEMETITRLDEAGSTYMINTTSDISGIGRFYIHTASEVLAIEKETSLDKISIFKTDKQHIRILGLEPAKTTITLFTLLGKEVVRKEFTAKNIEDILLPKLSKGVYLFQIKTPYGILNKKIIFE